MSPAQFVGMSEPIKPLPAFKIRLWAVIGEQASGKSSTVGALMSQTKKGRGGARDILLRGGGWLLVHCYRQSVQEARRSPDLSIEKALKPANRLNGRYPITYFNLLIALRSDICNGLPKADHYLARYIQAGWESRSVILLDLMKEYDRYARLGAPTAIIDNTKEVLLKERQRNWVFGQARNHYGWA